MLYDFKMDKEIEQKFLTSKEAKAELKVQDCDLAHIRNAGKLQFTKKGNAYLYSKESIERLKTKQGHN
jgi:hypothetical protein